MAPARKRTGQNRVSWLGLLSSDEAGEGVYGSILAENLLGRKPAFELFHRPLAQIFLTGRIVPQHFEGP